MGVHDRHTEAYQPMLPLWQPPADDERPRSTHDDKRRQPCIDLRKAACFTYDDAGVDGLFPPPRHDAEAA